MNWNKLHSAERQFARLSDHGGVFAQWVIFFAMAVIFGATAYLSITQRGFDVLLCITGIFTFLGAILFYKDLATKKEYYGKSLSIEALREIAAASWCSAACEELKRFVAPSGLTAEQYGKVRAIQAQFDKVTLIESKRTEFENTIEKIRTKAC